MERRLNKIISTKLKTNLDQFSFEFHMLLTRQMTQN